MPKNQNYIFVISFNFEGKKMAVSIGFALCLDYWINWIAFIPEVVTFQVFFRQDV